MEDIGKRLREIRKNYGLNQKELGQALTVSQSYICKVENGKEKPTEMFLKLVGLLYSAEEDL